ncbi:unnamed protein product [Trifolium pratense]|uniref:Uncharacterized protein n=1 Tax=Trifolium pratense TaxID=57577 RepID=A0ACB0IMM8_TRIPR|nr:unnamed protein product [Trifolium pratense]
MLKEMKYHVQKHILSWEDMFPLGGGYLHLKLQVAFSDEERDRIRMMYYLYF